MCPRCLIGLIKNVCYAGLELQGSDWLLLNLLSVVSLLFINEIKELLKKFSVLLHDQSIVTCIWHSLYVSPRRLQSCTQASSNLVYRDHMAGKQTLKDRTLRSIFDEFPMI